LAVIIVMVTISTRREVAIAAPPDQQPRPQLEAEDTVEVPMQQTETKVDKLAQ
jgi:hypothetical protein